ncbi:SART-1 family protein DOT2 [Diplonema papillatum]|nr:SART-1 family protein DOT2 [Diplonema papillatum]
MPKTAIEIGKTLTDDADDEDAEAWVRRMRESSKKGSNKRREQAYDELEEEVAKEMPEVKASGLKVGHAHDSIGAGTEYVLTLKDARILDKSGNLVDDEDVLENPELLASEKRTFEKDSRLPYNQYLDHEGKGPPTRGEKDFSEARKSFALDDEGEMNSELLGEEERRRLDDLAAAEGKTRYDLGSSEFTWNTVQRDTLTEQEMAQFKKPKKRVVRKRKKVEDVVKELDDGLEQAEQAAVGTRARHRTMQDEQVTALSKLEEREKTLELSRELAEGTERTMDNLAEASLEAVKAGSIPGLKPWQLQDDEGDADKEGVLIIDRTTEFARTIGADNSASDSKQRQEADEEPEAEMDEEQLRALAAADEKRKARLRNVQLLSEPQMNTLSGTMQFIKEKGLLARSYVGRANDAVLDFDPNDPNGSCVSRKDEFGRELTMHEAFRQHSQMFQGKLPSKRKTQVKEKRWAELDRMRKMAGTDTALSSMDGLRRAQENTGRAGVIVQGNLMMQQDETKRRRVE